MQNQMSRELVATQIKMSENELYHHGVLGMSWGDRNGPPYPLSGSAKKFARAEAKKKIEREKRLEKMRKAAAQKRKEQAKEAKRQEKIDKMKMKLLKKGDISKIYKKAKYFTNEELELARERNRLMVEAKYTKNAKKAPDPHAMEKVWNIVDRVGKIATAAVPVVTLMKGYAELKRMDNDMKLGEKRTADEAISKKISMLKEFDPEAAARFASKHLGVEVQYKDKDSKSKLSDKEKIDLLMKIDPDAAAKEAAKIFGNEGITYKQKSNVKDVTTLINELNKVINDDDTSDSDKELFRKQKNELLKKVSSE